MVGNERAALPEWCTLDVAPEARCPVDVTIEALRGRWTIQILRQVLSHGELTFSGIAAALPQLSDKVLSDRLAQLTASGVVTRCRTAGWPARVTYTITDRGRSLAPVVQAMWEWGAAAGDADVGYMTRTPRRFWPDARAR